MQFNGEKYGYIVNLQGDIVGLIDSAGTEVVKYVYDAWGKILSTTGSLASTLGSIQPFLYRGYVYDQETKLYYLRSRFYCAHHGRMLNIDTFIEAITFSRLNLFAYCLNNPSNRFDPSGNASINAMTSPYLNSLYMSQYYVKSAHDYREIVIDGMVELGYQYEEVSVMSDMQLYECLVNEVANTMNYNTKKGSMRIPNDTKAMMLLQELVIYSSDYSANQRYYALDIANACLERYSKETGTNFGIPADKIALEIRLHYDIYTLLQKFSINEEHTRVTDIIPTEGNIFQKGIDALYSWGIK